MFYIGPPRNIGHVTAYLAGYLPSLLLAQLTPATELVYGSSADESLRASAGNDSCGATHDGIYCQASRPHDS